ncbi:MAG: LysR family transcriptional regulator [Eggerthellaceae bacterium]|nr:LysR family transcriptional regulator [Eggerthellaceae bacterium]
MIFNHACSGGIMQIETLRYFTELAQAKSFYAAAKRLFISQQGLNKAVTALESELGVKLVERTRRGIRLTSAGEAFSAHAEAMLEEYSSMLDELYTENRFMAPDDSSLTFHVTYYIAQISRPFVDGTNAVSSARIAEEPFSQILESAAKSDGSELYCIDANANTLEFLANQDELIFEPIISSQFGVVWLDGSPLAGYRAIHREQLVDYPLAVDTHREMMRLVECVMEDYPLNNIRFGIAQPRQTLEYATRSPEVASTFDSFGFMLAQDSPRVHTDGLHYTPFSTPRSMCKMGFVYAKNAKPNVRARHAIDRLKRLLAEMYPEYMKRYPLDR